MIPAKLRVVNKHINLESDLLPLLDLLAVDDVDDVRLTLFFIFVLLGGVLNERLVDDIMNVARDRMNEDLL